MIIARVYGGLGNQLFIYAAARALALRLDQPLFLDPHNGYADDRYGRKFQLSLYCIEAEVLSADAAATYDMQSRRHYWRRKINRLLPLSLRWVVEEARAPEDALLKLDGVRTRYIDGYWASERYFAEAGDAVRRELQLRGSVRPHTAELGARMRREESVCLHARRVEYNRLLDADYYHRAVERIVAPAMQPIFYVFSDDMQWARDNIRLPGPVHYIEGNGEQYNYEDLWLMNRCRYHIIANSTFSWWGAWLKDDPDAPVVAPASWDYGAEVPQGWIRV
jgi:hypothetical protein